MAKHLSQAGLSNLGFCLSLLSPVAAPKLHETRVRLPDHLDQGPNVGIGIVPLEENVVVEVVLGRRLRPRSIGLRPFQVVLVGVRDDE